MNNGSSTEVKTLLQKGGYKVTKQRQMVYEIFLENPNRHLTTEEVFMETVKRGENIGIATVYRTVQLLEELGLLSSITFDDGLVRYEIKNKEENHTHHHLICNNCHKVMEVDVDLLDSLEEEVEKEFHFHVVDHNLKFYGYCEDCYPIVKGAEEDEEQ